MFEDKMKSGVIVIIAIVVLLAVVGGYFYLNQSQPDNDRVACAQDARQCPDGSYVARNPDNNCEFEECPAANNTQNNSQQNLPQTLNIEISGFAFAQKTIEINVGDTVTWTNKDSVQHTVTSDSGSELDSSYLSKNQQYSHTFTTAGTFAYHCIPHPSMTGTVVVG